MITRKQNIVTRNNVYLNPDFSPFKTEIHGFEMVFSSEFNKRRFDENIIRIQIELNKSLGKRFLIQFDTLELAIIKTYFDYEKRFVAITHKGEPLCQNNLKMQIKMQG